MESVATRPLPGLWAGGTAARAPDWPARCPHGPQAPPTDRVGVTGLWSRAAPATHHALSTHQHSDPYGEYLEWVTATATVSDFSDGPTTGPPHPRGADTGQGQAAGWAGSSAGTPTTCFTSAAARARRKTKATLSRARSGCTCGPLQAGLVPMYRENWARGGEGCRRPGESITGESEVKLL